MPADLRAEMSRSAALANPVWVEARKNNDFKSFLPVLRKNLDLRKRYIECFEIDDEPYDIVLDDYERGMKTKEVRRIFDYLKEHQAPLVKEVAAQGGNEPRAPRFEIEPQKVFELEVAHAFGFTDDAWRLDPTVHPFASGAGIDDIRITTRYFTEHLGGLFGTMHEFGHGLYEHQIDPALERTPLARGVSLGMHESQSRMWENLVGRSMPFWRHFFPRLQELHPSLADYDVERWYREANLVEPSFIRVEADEATYNLHIILRFELEQAMLAGDFPLEQLPDEWNSRMWDYLGITVPSDTEGVLQDVHWSGGSIGYFPTYALGNLISAQIWERDRRRPSRSVRRLRGGRVRAAPRLAAREPAPARPQVHAGRDARPRLRHLRDRPGAVRALPAREARCDLRDRNNRLTSRRVNMRLTSRADAVLVVPLLAAMVAAFGVVGADARWLAAVGSAIAHGGLVHSVPFASAPTRGWVNAPVLGELVFHWLWVLLGDRGLVLAQVIAVLAGFLVLARGLRREVADSASAAVVVFFVLVGSLPALLVARNQLFSLVLFPLLLVLLERESRVPSRRIWLAVPLLALWANLHGAVLVGYVLLVVYIVVARRRAFPVLLAATVALCATPALWHTPRYYAAVSENEAARMGVGLWTPLGTSPTDVLFVIAALTLLLVALAPSTRRWRAWEAVAVVGLAAASIHAARLGTWLLFVVTFPAVRALPVRLRSTVPVLVPAVLALAVVGGVVHTPFDPGSRALAHVAARSGSVVLAEPVPAEQVAVDGGTVWVANPLEAFRHADQRLYLDWAAGKARGRAAVEHARLVLVLRDTAAGRTAARDSRLVFVRRTSNAVLYRVRG